MEQCPLHCISPIIIAGGDGGRPIWVDGTDSLDVTSVIKGIREGPTSSTVKVVIRGKTFYVQPYLKDKLTSVVKHHPNIVQILLDLLTEKGFDEPKPEEETQTVQPVEPYVTEEPIVSTLTPDEVYSYFVTLRENPSYFFPIYKLLVSKGVVFPDVTKPFSYVTVNGARVDLPMTFRVDYTIKVGRQTFKIPKDLVKLVAFLSGNPDKLSLVLNALQTIGFDLVTGSGGQITAIKIFGKPYKLPRSVTATITVHGNKFVLPRDIPRLLGEIQSDPTAYHSLSIVLESFGVRPQKSNNGRITSVTFGGDEYPVTTVVPVTVTLNKKTYFIPADLTELLSRPDKLLVGQLLIQLEQSRVPLQVNPDTGSVTGVVMDGVTIPFPTAITLRVPLDGRLYTIPKDLPAFIKALVNKGVNAPGNALVDIYNLYGILPVRDENNVVVAIQFNGKKYPVPKQETTTIVVGGKTFVLPRDNDRLSTLLVESRLSVVDFILEIQQAGYKLLPGPNGDLRYLQKGFELFPFPVSFTLKVVIDGKTYVIPNDLPKLVAYIKVRVSGGDLESVLQELKKAGVQIRRRGGTIKLVFNGVEYVLRAGPSDISDIIEQVPVADKVTVHFNGEAFELPQDIYRMVAAVTASGPQVVAQFVNIMQSHGIVATLSPSGDIVAIVFQGKVYNIPRKTSSDSAQQVKVTIRDRTFFIPRDIGKLPRELPNFQWGELVAALHQAGAFLYVNSEDFFYGMRYKKRFIAFHTEFKISIILRSGGRSYMVPRDLKDLAQGLAAGNWDWSSVRRVLFQSGVEVKGGTRGAPRAIGFQGTFYPIGRA